MPADPWAVVSVGGAAPQAQPTQQPGDPWAVRSIGGGSTPSTQQTPAQPTQQANRARVPTEEEVDRHIQNLNILPDYSRKGFEKGMQEDLGWNLAAGVGSVPWKLLHGIDTALGAGESGPMERFTSRMANVPVTGGVQKTGEVGGNILGFAGGEEVLGLLGNLAKAGPIGEMLAKGKQVHDLITKVPMIGKLLGIGMDAVNAGARAGTVAGGQEYAMTGGQAEPAAETGLETAGTTAALTAMFH